MEPSLVKFLDDNREFIDGFTPTPSWFIRLEDKLKASYPVMYRNFFAELSFDILAMSEPEMAVIAYDSSHRYFPGIKFSNTNCWGYTILLVKIQRNTSFEELKEKLKEKVKGTIFGLDRSKEVICDLIDNIPENRMVEI